MTKKLVSIVFVIALCLAACGPSAKEVPFIEHNEWTIRYNQKKGSLDYYHRERLILADVSARAKVDEDTISSNQYKKVTMKRNSISDLFGKGEQYTFTYTGLKNKPDMEQHFYFYPGKDYFLTEVYCLSGQEVAGNYIAPVYTVTPHSFLPKDETNRILRVPFDNDDFVHYLSSPLTVSDVSFEVTAIFNGKNRNGFIIGSVEHDTWKTGIRYTTEENQQITFLECFGGITHELTRDISDKPDRPSLEHGKIKGKKLKSPKLLIGFFDDWRRGLEQFGEVNAIIAPPRTWEHGVPFGWNSWGAMADKVNYEGSIDVADFIKKELQPHSFENEGITYIGLDSFWDNFSNEELRNFVEHCESNGQKAGIYWCPFSDWHGNSEAYVEGTENQWKYKDIYLYANGHPRKVESLAVDPTHPGTKQRIKHYISRFKELGYTYVKLDFINNGTLEADSFYNPEVTTGIQAYNEGMSYLSELCGKDMFLALSIAPTFPAQYGTSKRISCDTWGAMTETDWGSTGYMLNSLSFGWWLDRVYPFNDADHILIYKPEEAADYQAGANRARVTSAVITGIYMLGDNLSLKGRVPGTIEAREKTKAAVTNRDINEIARSGKSFYPVEGYTAAAPGKAERIYMSETNEYVYIAIFNFDKENWYEGKLDTSRLGWSKEKKITGKELWTSTPIETENNSFLNYSVAPQDVRVYRLNK